MPSAETVGPRGGERNRATGVRRPHISPEITGLVSQYDPPGGSAAPGCIPGCTRTTSSHSKRRCCRIYFSHHSVVHTRSNYRKFWSRQLDSVSWHDP